MPTLETISNTIRTEAETIISEFADEADIVRIWDNAGAVDGDGVGAEREIDKFHVGISIIQGDTLQVEVATSSTARFRNTGVVEFALYSPLNLGDKQLLAYADAIIQAIRARSVTGVHFRTPRVQRVGRVGGAWQMNVVCPYYADDTTLPA